MIPFLRSRRREAEWMDDLAADPVLLADSLAFIRRINRRLGYTRIILHHLDRFSKNWKAAETIRVLDVGTGSADIPLAILRWADERKYKVAVVGLDINPEVARLAAEHANDPRLTLVCASAMGLPFADRSFDYAITSMFLHHLSDADADWALGEMGRVSRRGVIISDLLRLGYSYAFISFFTLLANPMVKHDARVSVAQSFNRGEILALRNRAGLDFAEYSTHLFHRFVLAGERPQVEQSR